LESALAGDRGNGHGDTAPAPAPKPVAPSSLDTLLGGAMGNVEIENDVDNGMSADPVNSEDPVDSAGNVDAGLPESNDLPPLD